MRGSMASQRRRKRAHGEATIEQVGAKFRARMMVGGVRLTGPLVQRRADALPALREKHQAALDGIPPSQAASLADAVLSCIDDRQDAGEIRPSTAALQRHLAKHVSAAPIGAIPVYRVAQSDVDTFLAGIQGSNHQRRNLGSLISTALRHAGGPEISYRATKDRSLKARWLTADERKNVFAAAESMGEDVLTLIGLLMECGLRRGEALGLAHEDRDADGVRVLRQVVSDGEGLRVTSLKTTRSKSWIPLPAWLQARIGEPRKGLVLASAKGPLEPRSPLWVNGVVSRVAAVAGIGKVTPHDLRRTAAMAMIESGADIVTVAAVIRDNPQTLLRYYTESRRDLKRSAIQGASSFNPKIDP